MKNARLDIKTTKDAKITLEHAVHLLGTTLSAFLLDAAMSKAREVIAQYQIISLSQEEANRFINALENSPKPNEKLKQLFLKHEVHEKNQ